MNHSWNTPYPHSKRIRLDGIFEATALFLMVAGIVLPPLRYLTYGLPALGSLVILANGKAYLPEITKPYLVVIFAGIVLLPNANSEGYKDLYLILAGLSAGLVSNRVTYSWRTLFLICIAGLFVEVAAGGFSAIKNFALDFTTANRSLASSLSFIFGMFAVWAAYEKQWRNFLIALFMTILTAKRIAILGVLFCLALQWLPTVTLKKLLHPFVMLTVNVLFILLILLYGSGVLDYTIYELTGKSANAFGLGRQTLYSAVVAEYLRDPLQFLLAGTGPGQTYDILKAGQPWHSKENLHSDVLKIVSEYGGIAFTVLIWALYSSRRKIVLLFALYTNTLFLTDNTLIYPFYIYFLIRIVSSAMAAEDERNRVVT